VKEFNVNDNTKYDCNDSNH